MNELDPRSARSKKQLLSLRVVLHKNKMPAKDFPENVRLLLFSHIDSVEQLDVLLLMRFHAGEWFDSCKVSGELRSSPQSVLKRMKSLQAAGFLEVPANTTSVSESTMFRYAIQPGPDDTVVRDLAETYKKKPQKVLEIIFSPLKKGRLFADAFVVGNKGDNDDG